MFEVISSSKFKSPVPSVMWSINPKTQIITLRPAWDPYTKLMLPNKLDSYFTYGHILSLAKLIRVSGFYPENTKILTIVKKNLAFFREGNFKYLGRNTLLDPWYADNEPIASINYYFPNLEYPDLPKIYEKRN